MKEKNSCFLIQNQKVYFLQISDLENEVKQSPWKSSKVKQSHRVKKSSFNYKSKIYITNMNFNKDKNLILKF